MGTIANIKNNTQIRIPRSFIVKSIKNLPSKIELRDSTQSLSAQKLGIKIDQLKELGISENGICLPKLRFALGKRIPDEIKLRKGEGRTKDNVTSVIVGRLGKEEIVFKARFGLNILNRIRLISASYKALGLFNILWSDVRELPFAISAFIKFTSRMTTVSLFDISSRPTFIADIVQELYPGKVPLQGRFLTRIIKAQYFDAHSQGKYSSKVAKALCSNIFSQGKFIGETAKTLYADIASQVIFIRGATKELYPDNILSQGVFMGELIRTLYSDDISSQIMLVTEIAKMSCSEEISLQGAFIAQLVKGVCYSDVSLK
ncbi:MAG: hypothetical protein NT030_00960 [Candidatus Saganbacteria bacterium]|nr:hypothetical protein [Candidatus Saganbacteria bacterium]